MTKKTISWIVCGVFFIFAVLLYTFTPTFVYKIPSNIDYAVDVVSIDNFYDDESDQYAGEVLSETTFALKSTSNTENVVVIDALFDVRTQNGDPIIRVEKQYGIDRNSGMHVSTAGDAERTGYLFAPQNIQEGSAYEYWHVTDTQSQQMEYVGTEIIHGVELYHYKAESVVDQTEILGSELSLSEDEVVQKTGSIETWIDPKSGWLVAYEDQAQVTIVNADTGEEIAPRNYFQNSYTRESIIDNLQYVKELHATHNVIGVVIPIVFVVFGLLVVLFASHRIVSIRKRGLIVIVLLVGSIVAVYYTYVRTATVQVEPLKVGIARWITADRFDRNVDAFKQAFLDAGYEEGVGVVYYDSTANADVDEFTTILDSFVEKDVDLIYTMTTPAVLNAKKADFEIPIVYSVVTHPVEAGLIDSLKSSGNNIVGVRHSVPQTEYLTVARQLFSTAESILYVHGQDQLNSIAQAEELREEQAAYEFDITVQSFTDEEQVNEFLSSPEATQYDIVYIGCDAFMQQVGTDIVLPYYKTKKIPMMSCTEGVVPRGVLFSLTRNFSDVGNLAGERALAVLNKQISPSILSSITPITFDTILNQGVADSLDIVLSQSLLLQADVVLYE